MDFREYRGLTRNGIWIYGSLIYDKPFYTIRQNINLQSDVISDTVGQWTGCYDLNKVKIFEKDIRAFYIKGFVSKAFFHYTMIRRKMKLALKYKKPGILFR